MGDDTDSRPRYYEYTVRPGDTLSEIMARLYGIGPRDSRYSRIREYVLSINPHIKHPDRILIGDVIRLGEHPDSRSIRPQPTRPELHNVPDGRPFTEPMHRLDRDYFWALSWLEHNSKALTVPGSIAFSASSNLLSPGNRALISEVSEL